MSYILNFKNPAVDPFSKTPIVVQVGSVNTTSTSLALTGKGYGNYGAILQENQLRLLENFADTTAPPAPTIGQTWYDSETRTLKVLSEAGNSKAWKSLGGVQITGVGESPPLSPSTGDLWFERTGSASGFLYVYTGLGRYPQTGTTIGGWDQIYPDVQTFAGRDEYDSIRELVEQLAGDSLGAYGTGAIGRSITNLTNFGALDNDLRVKYTAAGSDSTVLSTSASDISFTKQDLSSTMFFHSDGAGTNPNDAVISGSASDLFSAGTIFLNGVSTLLPAGTMSSSQHYEDAYIMWDSLNALGGNNSTYRVVRFDEATKQFFFDNDVSWVEFTPSQNQYFVGTTSTFSEDSDAFPGGKNGFIWSTAVPLVGPKISSLKVEPNSQDWDKLLAAAKYAISRLEVPAQFMMSISSSPFVIDGRQAPSSLTSLSTSDIRYPSAARRSNRKVGAVSQVQNFAETVNALHTALSSRFSIRGINGNSGTNPNFGPSVSITPHVALGGTAGSGAGGVRVKFRFANESEASRWLASGQGIQVQVSHSGGNTPADSQLRTFLAEVGTWRLTADKTRFFGQSLPLTSSSSTANLGLWNATQQGKVVATRAISGSNMSATVYRAGNSGKEIDLAISFNAPSALTGNTTISMSLINDAETYGSGARVYPSPLPYVSSDVVSSSLS